MSKLIKCKSCNNEIDGKAKTCPSCGANNKKPLYKKVWFWILVVFIIAGIGGAAGGDSSTEGDSSKPQVEDNKDKDNSSTANKDDKKDDKKDAKIKAGTYKIGTDLPAGEYIFFAKGMGYLECSSDSTGKLESIVFNQNVQGHSYLTVNDGEYLKIQGGDMYPVADAPSVIPEDGLYKDGMYKVGQDIPAGEYKIILKSSMMGYYEVANDSRHGLLSIVTNENVQADTYLTVQDGQYLKITGVEIQK